MGSGQGGDFCRPDNLDILERQCLSLRVEVGGDGCNRFGRAREE